MDRALKIECDYLRLALIAILADKPIEERMDDICNNCPLKSAREKAEKCLGNPPTKIEDIIDEPL